MSKNDDQQPNLSDIVGDSDETKSLIDKIDWQRPVTQAEIEYLLSRFPFLQLLNPEADFSEEVSPTFYTAQSGWVVHDFVNALCASPGKFIFGGSGKNVLLKIDEDDDDEGGGDAGSILRGKGTIVNQAFVTAYEMVKIAMERGWPSIQIIDGHRIMKWAAWMACEDFNKVLLGFTPTDEDNAKRKRVQMDDIAVEKLRRQLRP